MRILPGERGTTMHTELPQGTRDRVGRRAGTLLPAPADVVDVGTWAAQDSQRELKLLEQMAAALRDGKDTEPATEAAEAFLWQQPVSEGSGRESGALTDDVFGVRRLRG